MQQVFTWNDTCKIFVKTTGGSCGVMKITADGYTITESSGVKLLQFNHIAQSGIFAHGFSTRIGGVSPAPYDSLNLGFTTADREENLRVNRKRFFEAVGIGEIPYRQLIHLVHGNLVVNADEIPDGTEPVKADGVVSDRLNVALVTTFADCIPVLLADPVKRAAAVIHAGWRGTFERIAACGVQKMCKDFNSNPCDILAGIGPGIGRCCFEVGPDVTNLFFSEFHNLKDLITDVSNTNRRKIDLQELNREILFQARLRKENIVVADLCTFCHEDLFFSYRRDGKVSGRMAAVIARVD
jgi:polyphenol oxidase